MLCFMAGGIIMVERVAIFSNGYDLSKQVEGSLKKELEKQATF